ncbi:MAG: hypothetical protein II917_06180, partial [Synergistaceae bacterium]|nr:hypothetical protein [Synergistaceae bacterium]
MSYLMKYPDRYNSLLFGSSCVSAIHVEKIDDVKCYNMTYPNSVPSEYLQNIKTLLDNHMHIKRVYIGLETGSYTHSAGANSRQPMTCQYEYLRDNPYKMITLFFNPSMILRSLPVMVSYVRKRSSGTLNRASLKEDFYGSGAIIAYGMRDDGTNPLARSIYADSKFSEHVHVLKDI